ncbi:MAG: non-homologous end-joining DNA ligase [Kofleriaceae bacterium]|nr:non-homologous end-joining DNA ligase [Kofleriaceae bacterium]
MSTRGLPIDEVELASLVRTAPDGDEWLHEQKFDGYRILADKGGDVVKLLSRRFKDWTETFPRIARAVRALPIDRLVLDGEVCVVMPDGRTSFQALQGAFGETDANLVYFVFDALVIGNDALVALPLEERKARLRELLPTRGRTLQYSDHVIGRGAEFLALACKRGLEGIVSKRRDRPYRGGRGKDWLKIKCWLRQELVIGGFTEPSGSRSGIGALLVGYYQGGKLIYAGKVGTGFSMKVLGELFRTLGKLEQSYSPFTPAPPRAWTGPGVHWVAPSTVAEVAFSEWTHDGRLRHPSFQGLRLDKLPREVVREA